MFKVGDLVEPIKDVYLFEDDDGNEFWAYPSDEYEVLSRTESYITILGPDDQEVDVKAKLFRRVGGARIERNLPAWF